VFGALKQRKMKRLGLLVPVFVACLAAQLSALPPPIKSGAFQEEVGAPSFVDGSLHSVAFVPIGTYSARTDYLHIRIPMDFSTILDAVGNFLEEMNTTRIRSEFANVHSAIKKISAEPLALAMRDFNGLISTLPQYPVTPNDKSKRFLDLILGIFGSALSGGESYAIEKLDHKIDKAEKEVMLLKDITQLQDNHLKYLDGQVEMHSRRLKDFLDNNPDTTASAFSAMQNTALNWIQLATSTITHAQAHRLAPGVYSEEALESIVSYTTDLAFKKGLVNFIHHTSDLYQLETSFLYNPQNKTFITILHIPLVRPENLLKMYKYLPMPLNSQLTSNHSLMPNVGHMDIIAVGGQEAYKVLSDSDLHNCLILANTHFCKHSNVVSINRRATCLSSIFSADAESTRQQCKFWVTPMKEAVYQKAKNEYIIFTKHPMYIQEVCGGAQTSAKTNTSFHRVTNGETVQVRAGCKIMTREHLLVGDLEDNFVVEDMEEAKSWAWSVSHLFPNIELDRFDEVLERLNAKGFHHLDASDLLHQLDLAATQPDSKLYWIAYFTTGVVCIILASLVFIWIRKRCQLQKQQLSYGNQDKLSKSTFPFGSN